MIYSTQEELDAALAYWQGVLRLRDWTIIARLEEDWDIGALAKIVPHWDAKRAVIDISKNGVDGLHPRDHEADLVHELLHLHTRAIVRELDLKADSGQVGAEEVAVNLIAEALVGLNRRGAIITGNLLAG